MNLLSLYLKIARVFFNISKEREGTDLCECVFGCYAFHCCFCEC